MIAKIWHALRYRYSKAYRRAWDDAQSALAREQEIARYIADLEKPRRGSTYSEAPAVVEPVRYQIAEATGLPEQKILVWYVIEQQEFVVTFPSNSWRKKLPECVCGARYKLDRIDSHPYLDSLTARYVRCAA